MGQVWHNRRCQGEPRRRENEMNGFLMNDMYDELVFYWDVDKEVLDASIEENGYSENTLRDVLYDEVGETTFKCEEDEEE